MWKVSKSGDDFIFVRMRGTLQRTHPYGLVGL